VTNDEATLTVTLKNTSPAANGGFITGFVFNNPDDAITGISKVSFDPSEFELLNSSNAVSASPFGQFDFGAALGGAFLGGGSPNDGIPVGETGTFVFKATGTGVGNLTFEDFVNELSVAKEKKKKDEKKKVTDDEEEDTSLQFFAVRFKGFEDGKSDKVAGEPHATPEPASLTLMGLGAVGFACYSWRRKKAAAA
jgi:hypothetical protein